MEKNVRSNYGLYSYSLWLILVSVQLLSVHIQDIFIVTHVKPAFCRTRCLFDLYVIVYYTFTTRVLLSFFFFNSTLKRMLSGNSSLSSTVSYFFKLKYTISEKCSETYELISFLQLSRFPLCSPSLLIDYFYISVFSCPQLKVSLAPPILSSQYFVEPLVSWRLVLVCQHLKSKSNTRKNPHLFVTSKIIVGRHLLFSLAHCHTQQQ